MQNFTLDFTLNFFLMMTILHYKENKGARGMVLLFDDKTGNAICLGGD